MLLVILVVLLPLLGTRPTTVRASSSPSVPRLHGILADYDNELREATPRADGIYHVDTPALIAKLQAAHINTYAYLIYHQTTDWDDLSNEFMPAAQNAGIFVWVYLVPPTEAPANYPPYQQDYVARANAIATLSLTYPNPQVLAMDDFRGNLSKFTTSYVEQITTTLHATNPNLGFWPVLYYGDIVGTGSVFTGTTNYRNLFDGVIFPYRDDPNHNTSVTATAASQIEAVHAAISDKHNLPTDTHVYEIRYPWGKPSSAGWYGQAAQTVTVPSAPSYSITFRVSDDFTAGTAGYHFKQLLVDNTVVWEDDVAGDEGWQTVTKDLKPYLSTGAHTIKFRVYDKQGVSNFGVRARFDDVTTTGFTLANGDFEGGNTGWTFTASGSHWTGGANAAASDNSYGLSFPWSTASSAGWYAQAAQTVSVPTASSYSITFWDKDDFTGPTAGYHFKQLLVDNMVVWEEDVAGGDAGWHLVTKDLTPYLAAGTHTIKFRVYDKKGVSNFGVNAWFDDITTQGFTLADADFEGVTSPWVYSENGAPWTGGVARTTENLPLVVMVYASQLHCTPTPCPAPTPDYVNTVASTALDLASQGYADGVITYAMNKTGQDATDANGNIVSYAAVYDKIQALYGSWLPAQTQQGRISFLSGTPSAPGDYGQIAQTIAVTPGQSDYTMGFWLKDDFTATTAGYHFKQLLVNGVVVWEEDVAYDEAELDQGFISGNPPGWQYVYVDLTQQLQGVSSATIALRVYDKQGVANFGVNVFFDQIATTGFALANASFDGTTGWTFTSHGSGWSFAYVP
jgi:hypothetical protein